jgi:hypothetical protein
LSARVSIVASLVLPLPKPSTVKKTPLLRLSSINRVSSPWLVVPTLKSPSLAKITRLMPPFLNCCCATE